jgi:hypothetical protein
VSRRPAASAAPEGISGPHRPSPAAAVSGPFLPRRRDRQQLARAQRRGGAAVRTTVARRPVWPALAVCLLLAVLSLLGPSQPTYDPWAWIIWGREIVEGDLVTTSGPSWKPLPVLFTAPFALFGDEAAPALWLVVARTGGLMAIVLAYRLASRLCGRPGGLVSAGALLLSDEFVRHFARGNSEGLLVALCLAAVERHLDGRRGTAFALGLAAALLRPEVWPFFGLYGLWLALGEPRRRPAVLAAFAAVAILWFVPEYLGSGDLLRAAERARQANADSAAHAERPFLEVFRRAAGLLTLPVWVGGAVAVVLALRAGRRQRSAGIVLALAGGAAILMIGVGLMTEVGFAGNLRYVALPAALVCVLAGVGWTWLIARIARRRSTGVAVAAAALLALVASAPVAASVSGFGESTEALVLEAAVYDDLDVAIARAGGPAAVHRCGRVITGPYEVQVLAWKLHRHGADIDIEVRPPGTVFAVRGSPLAGVGRFEAITATERWVVRRSCGS